MDEIVAHKDKNKARECKKRYRTLNRTKYNESQRRYRKSSTKYRTRNNAYMREWRLQYNFGISPKEYDSLLKSQHGVCYICGNSPKTKRLAVDHKHILNEKKIKKNKQQNLIRENIRGILCHKCNRGLPLFNDNPELFRKAAEYLEQWPAQQVLKKEKEE